ncbi:hypothetical protein [Wolbachia endosymbiont of Oedothorax gibbosus]|uniref:hypothetical protein n=1 Tax=Wolbachia endosymbiont of Oedothorax gibbosus TaxID=931100 RepID=UPI0020254E5B|nr:hypothetical protein [Wolbachia endosymbiont of Oedothorax gibbosus]
MTPFFLLDPSSQATLMTGEGGTGMTGEGSTGMTEEGGTGMTPFWIDPSVKHWNDIIGACMTSFFFLDPSVWALG